MEVVALRIAYVGIGFFDEAALVITDKHIIDCMEELDILTDGEIKNICKVVRRPGGIIP